MKIHKINQRHVPSYIVLIILTFILSIIGVLFVFEASVAESYSIFGNQYHFLKQHSIGLIISLIAFIVGFITPSKLWIKISPILYLIGIILLILVFIPRIGMSLNGASRWIYIGGINFQSVEFFKFSLIAFYASWLTKHQKLTPFLFLTSIPILLIILQPDLGSLLIVSAIASAIFFIAGGNIKSIAGIAAIGIIFLLIAIISSPYRMNRIKTFIDPESDPLGTSFHIRQITLALGRGGIFGQGIGESQQKFSYIPEASTDSIFSIIAEEIGFIGSLSIIILYCLFFYFSYKAISNAQVSKEEKLLGFGIILWIASQVILNLSAVVALVPLTGVPLPFISYGRSSLVMILFATGILIKIGKQTEKNK